MNFEAARLRECIQNQVEPEPFSGVVHLTKGDEILFEAGSGLAIRSERIPNTIDTRFQTASGCKIFTSVAICRLVEQGRLSFDALLSDCVDVAFPNFAPDITIHHLLTHCSGITSYFEEDVDPDYEALWQDVPMYKVRGPRDFLPLFQHKPMKFAPGERFEYNDGGYILLGLVVECVTGTDFTTFEQENVFRVAGMQDSGYFATDRLPERTAYAYIEDDDGAWRTNFYAVPIIGAPDGGAYTTARDMARFWRALISGRLLSAEMTGSLLESQIVTTGNPTSTHYGYGVWINQAEGLVRNYFVEGFDPGVAMKSSFYPDEDLLLTVIGNTNRAPWPLYEKLEALLGL
jgi:CubicO group peptidase (beta-lactamase class C family)